MSGSGGWAGGLAEWRWRRRRRLWLRQAPTVAVLLLYRTADAPVLHRFSSTAPLLYRTVPPACRYVGTIGHLEASYVIQRFLDVQRTQHLAQYLERLHALVRAGGCRRRRSGAFGGLQVAAAGALRCMHSVLRVVAHPPSTCCSF